eukprot:COSAG04_NODE_15272_length_537_cov_1.063927_1_plen_50_part_01
MVLTFGDDQKGFKLQFATDEGKEICAKVSTTKLADDPSGPGLRCSQRWSP